MARLTESDKAILSRAKPWVQSDVERSPKTVGPTVEARERYCRWATQAAKFFKGTKPVRFKGDNWKL